ncbi:MAG: Helix-turn-helix domain [Dehalococcoidia bacterium]|nr:Helix-turn-helix domain [Dehalococcoidia bacterium]
MKVRSKKKAEFYLSPRVLSEILSELREEVDNIEKWGGCVVEQPPDATDDELSDWLGEIDGSLMHMGVIMQLLQEQADLLWDRLPDDEDDEHDEEEDSVFFSLAEAARAFGLSPHTLRNQVAHGRLEAVKIGRNWATRREWMEEYLSSRKKNAKNGVTQSG